MDGQITMASGPRVLCDPLARIGIVPATAGRPNGTVVCFGCFWSFFLSFGPKVRWAVSRAVTVLPALQAIPMYIGTGSRPPLTRTPEGWQDKFFSGLGPRKLPTCQAFKPLDSFSIHPLRGSDILGLGSGGSLSLVGHTPAYRPPDLRPERPKQQETTKNS